MGRIKKAKLITTKTLDFEISNCLEYQVLKMQIIFIILRN